MVNVAMVIVGLVMIPVVIKISVMITYEVV